MKAIPARPHVQGSACAIAASEGAAVVERCPSQRSGAQNPDPARPRGHRTRWKAAGGGVPLSSAGALKASILTGVSGPNVDCRIWVYTTTLERQAQSWAYQAAERITGETAAVIRIEVDRDELAGLHALAFVRGDFDAEDYWSFVVHCRSGARDHRRAGHPGGLYDLVIGPVASFWRQRTTIAGSDQISFHTVAAETVLNSSPRLLTWISNL